LNKSSVKELWAAVNSKPGSTTANGILGCPDSLNLHFAKISYDANVSSIEHFKDTCNIPNNRLVYSEDDDIVSSYASQDSLIKSVTDVQVVERMLSSLKKTAAGLDNIPCWFFKKCSFEISNIVSHIINCSLSTGEVSAQWLMAVITPIPKIPHATDITNYRPILSLLFYPVLLKRSLLINISDLYSQKIFSVTNLPSAPLVVQPLLWYISCIMSRVCWNQMLM
jgi:hypothetical protein